MILITGGTGLVGTCLKKRLDHEGVESVAIGSEQDLRNRENAEKLFQNYTPDTVIHLAARVGGIHANSGRKADFYSDNVLINTHVINACAKYRTAHVLAMGSVCAYPKRLEGELLHEDLYLDGVPEKTSDAYAHAKRGLLVHLQAAKEQEGLSFTYCIPANLYGPGDNFHPLHSHVVPALVRRLREAKNQNLNSIEIWGDGSAKRDFLFVEDLTDALFLLVQKKYTGILNIGSGRQTSIMELAHTIREIVGFTGEMVYNTAYPTGQGTRKMDLSRILALGWKPCHSISLGIRKTVDWFMENRDGLREK